MQEVETIKNLGNTQSIAEIFLFTIANRPVGRYIVVHERRHHKPWPYDLDCVAGKSYLAVYLLLAAKRLAEHDAMLGTVLDRLEPRPYAVCNDFAQEVYLYGSRLLSACVGESDTSIAGSESEVSST